MGKIDLAKMSIKVYTAGDGEAVELAPELVKPTTNRCIDAKAKQLVAESKGRKTYIEALREVIKSNELLANLYIYGPEPRIRYYIQGEGAEEFIESLTDR